MKTVMRTALLMFLSLFLAQSASAEQYGCQAASSDFHTIYITSLFNASSAQSGRLDAQWKDYVARQYGGGMQTMCSIGDPAAYNQAIQSARSGGQSVQIVNWTPSTSASSTPRLCEKETWALAGSNEVKANILKGMNDEYAQTNTENAIKEAVDSFKKMSSPPSRDVNVRNHIACWLTAYQSKLDGINHPGTAGSNRHNSINTASTGNTTIATSHVASNQNPSKNANESRQPNNKSNHKYRDGTTCIKLEAADSNGVSFWKNNCSFPVSISWADEQCTSGFACGTSLNVKPGGKDSVMVKGRYTAAACEYPGIVRDLDGARWQPGNGRHSCK